MHRAVYHKKLAALAGWALQHVVQVGTRKARPQTLNHRLKIHWLVEIAVRRIAAMEVQAVIAGQITEGFVCAICHAQGWHESILGTRISAFMAPPIPCHRFHQTGTISQGRRIRPNPV